MKTILTLDKANIPYGFPQLDGSGNISASIRLNGTASYADNANTSLSSSYAANGTQWADIPNGIEYTGNIIKIGGGLVSGLGVTSYNIAGNIVGQFPANESQMGLMVSSSTQLGTFTTPDINNLSLGSDFYALVVEGYITVPTNTTYYFGLDSDDASDAFINNVKVADWYGGHGGIGSPGGNQYPISLTAGTYPILVRFQEWSGGDFVTLYYFTGSMSWTPVPSSWFSHEAQYITNITSSNWYISASGEASFTFVTGVFAGQLLGTSSWAESASISVSSSYTISSSYAESASYTLTSSYAESSSYSVNSDYAQTASHINPLVQDVAITGSFSVLGNIQLNGPTTISGSLVVLGDSTFYGSSSFVYVTASQLAVSASTISVNVFEPVERFGGLVIYDSGSSNATASLLWDSLHNHFIYENVSGSTYTGGMFLSGPRNTGSLGDEPTLTTYFVPRSDGGDHLNDSQIYSSGSTHIVTGSLTVTGGVSGSFSGSGADLFNIPASGIVGLNLSQISSGSVSASISPNNGLQVNTNVTATSFTGSLFGTASWSRNALTASFVTSSNVYGPYGSNSILSSSYALSASFAPPTFPFTGSAIISGSLTVTGSTSFTGNTGTTVFSTNADTLIMTGSFKLSGSMNVVGIINGTASYALTASYIDGGFY